MKEYKYINKFCTGCGLCESCNLTTLKTIEKGFPNVILSKEDEVDRYKDICPVYYYRKKCTSGIWGEIKSSIVAYSSNSETRFKAASGGALTEICVYLLESHKVDGIIQTKYKEGAPTETVTCISLTPDEVRNCCGSRYSISSPLKDILSVIDKEKKYAFVGKPCDVMALRNYINKNENYKGIIPILLSFFCAGEPSADAQKALVERLGSDLLSCKSITYRGNGWPGYTTVERIDGTTEKLDYNTAWGQYLGRDIRYICRFCLDGTGEAADIVCADFWYLNEEGKPDFSEHEGRNIVIARSLLGSEILNNTISSGKLILEENYLEKMPEFNTIQPHQYKRKSTMSSMIFAMRMCGKDVPIYSRSFLSQYSKHSSINEKMKAFYGTVKRIIQRRI